MRQWQVLKSNFLMDNLYSGTLHTQINGHKQKSFMRLGGRGGQTEIDGVKCNMQKAENALSWIGA